MLQSHLQDTWVTPTAAPASATAVRDAVTGETVCHVSAEGLDLAGAYHHALRVGGFFENTPAYTLFIALKLSM